MQNIRNSCSPVRKYIHQMSNGENILELINKLSIYQWSNKLNPTETHIGPAAEDFYSLFKVGIRNDKLSSVDLGGTSIATIQALYKRIKQLELSIEILKIPRKDNFINVLPGQARILSGFIINIGLRVRCPV